MSDSSMTLSSYSKEKVTGFILFSDKLPPERDNIGEYTCHLAAGLREYGYHAEVWTLRSTCSNSIFSPCTSFVAFGSTITRMYHFVRMIRGRTGCTLLWQYNPFLYGWKGLPSPIYVLPLLTRILSKCRVGIVFHEICYTPERDPRSWVWAICQRFMLWLTLLGSDLAIATTPARQAYLERFAHRFLPQSARHLIYATIPVGSNIPVLSQVAEHQRYGQIIRIGTFRSGLGAQDLNLLRNLYYRLTQAGLRIQLLFIGGSPPVGSTRQYRQDDDQPGIVETRYLSASDLSSLMSRLDVFVGWYDDGASGRRTSLAAAFAHGLCIISTQGPNTDRTLFRHQENCLLVPCKDVNRLYEALLEVIGNVHLREQFAHRALETYQQRLAWPAIANRVLEALRTR